MNKKLVLISISGIQEFISNAKSIRELYAGSTLIKNVILKWYKQIQQLCGEKNFSMPPQSGNISKEDVPNCIIFTYKSKEEIDNDRLEVELSEKLRNNMDVYGLPFYVVCVDYDESKDESYNNAYLELSEKFRAYKNNRLKAYEKVMEKQKTNSENCTLCGKEKQLESSMNRYCYICEQKVNHPIQGKRPSTSSIASSEWKYYVEKKQKSEFSRFEEMMKNLGDNEKSEEFYYLDDLKKLTNTNESEKLKMELILKDLYKCEKPSNYFALIRMDIDDLGKYLSNTSCDLEEHQVDTFGKMRQFSQKVNEILNEVKLYSKEKVSIYSGGDDFLFFLPLDEIVTVLPNIYEKFHEVWKGTELTYSQSIVIAHRKSPLKNIMQESTKQLHAVKEYYKNDKKGGVSISLIYRGSSNKICFIKEKNEIEAMTKLLQLFKEKKITKSLAYSLQEHLKYIDGEFDDDDYLYEIAINEIRNICHKKSNDESLYFEEVRTLFDQSCTKDKICIDKFFEKLHILERLGGELI